MRSNDSDLRRLDSASEAFLGGDQPFESPAKEFVPGPYFMGVEEVMPELGDDEDSDEASVSKEKSKLSVDRRDFMRLFSAGAMLASASACVRRPVEWAVPYVDQPMDQTIGVPVYYATTVDGTGVMVKTREGRPVFVEGSGSHPLSQGSASQLAMSELQALYHPDRRKAPQIRYGTNRVSDVSWDDVYVRLGERLGTAKKIGILAKHTSGNSRKFYKKFLKEFGQSEDQLYLYDSNALRVNAAAAHRLAFGIDGYARTNFRLAELLVGIGSDFLDVGTSKVFESKNFSRNMSYKFQRKGEFVQFESRTTMTGGKSTTRHPISTGDELAVTLLLVEALLENSAAKGTAAEKENIRKVLSSARTVMDEARSRLGFGETVFKELAKNLLTKKSVVMVGESSANSANGTLLQLAGIMANLLAGSYEDKTLDLDRAWMVASSGDNDMARFLRDAKSMDLLIVVDVNPAFTLPASTGIRETLQNIPSIVSVQSMPCETDEYAEFVLNGHNILEKWGDEEPVAGVYSLVQPTVRPFTDSMQAEDILMWASAHAGKPLGYQDYRSYLMDQWKELHTASELKVDFKTFFDAHLRKGWFSRIGQRDLPELADVSEKFNPAIPKKGLKFVAYLDPRLYDGVGADRPVLQECADAMTTVCWDTWVGLAPQKCKDLGLKYNDLVALKGPSGTIEVSVYPLPGLHADTVVVPRGNGHADGVSRVSTGVGVDPLTILEAEYDSISGIPVTSGQTVEITATGRRYRLAAQQKHNDMANRKDILKTVSLATASANDLAKKEFDLDDVPDLYPKLKEHPHYRWGMSIDLEKCNGCGACTVACDLENNVPQVGREQILLGREMHWVRVDRYFSGSVENPTVSFQPVSCQHCNHAPCEAVCPVYATTHDEEGMNNQTYNRCVGTRYCANACPYKVRRFNWFTHKWNVMGDRPIDRNPRALNPEVTVRTRGIMEKCTYCVQRIRDAKHNAAAKGRIVADGEISVACESACDTDAIVFGNLKDKNSRVAVARKNMRSYLMLGADPHHKHYGLKTLPNTSYMAKVDLHGAKDKSHDEH
ncbi:MAG: 4Fe-4S dicluster domain-containing protein [Pseudobacteriovorax sp.]|nr:4Fe-4S dicluster domain-containing protein [Pseudobacteriovorax sp.]